MESPSQNPVNVVRDEKIVENKNVSREEVAIIVIRADMPIKTIKKIVVDGVRKKLALHF